MNYFQNSKITKHGVFLVETTMKKVIVYDLNGKMIGQAGVNDSGKFDFDLLFRLALSKSGEQLCSIY